MAAKKTYDVTVNRQKAAQAASLYDIAELPTPLDTSVAAIRVGKQSREDEVLIGPGSVVEDVSVLYPGAALAIFGRSESRWAINYHTRSNGEVTMTEMLSYARQLIGMTPDGDLVVCLCGHAGQGTCIPLWAPQEEAELTVQPNDVILRFDNIVPTADLLEAAS